MPRCGDSSRNPWRANKTVAANTKDQRALNLATGRAQFVDDRMPARRMLEVALVCSPYARAGLGDIDTAAAEELPGVRAVLTAGSVGGANNISPEGGELPLFAGRLRLVSRAAGGGGGG